MKAYKIVWDTGAGEVISFIMPDVTLREVKERLYSIARSYECGKGAIIAESGEAIYLLVISVSDYTQR